MISKIKSLEPIKRQNCKCPFNLPFTIMFLTLFISVIIVRKFVKIIKILIFENFHVEDFANIFYFQPEDWFLAGTDGRLMYGVVIFAAGKTEPRESRVVPKWFHVASGTGVVECATKGQENVDMD